MANVLIVEDEASLRETLVRYLGREGHEVFAAADGREAFDRGLSAGLDVLVTDWMLKNHIHGLHVSEALRAVNPSLNTVLITGFPSKDLAAESRRCGAVEVLEKPFDLEELSRAVREAASAAPIAVSERPLAVVEVTGRGELIFASDAARRLFEDTPTGREADSLSDVLGHDIHDRLETFREDWASVEPTGTTTEQASPGRWWLRTRPREEGGWLLVLFPDDERERMSDHRVRILLDHSSGSTDLVPDQGPVIVIEHDSGVQRLLVSQIERFGSLCYPVDDLDSALKLLRAEPRTATVLVDLDMAKERAESWVRSIRALRANVKVIGTGGRGSRDDLLATGVDSLLARPWRIIDLMEAMSR
jgi:DNA-binding NtrC family response regulator